MSLYAAFAFNFFPPVVLFFVFFLYASLFFLLFPLTPSWSWEKADPVWAWFCWTISLFCFLVHRGFSRFSLLHFKIPTLQCRESKDDCCCKLSFWNSVSVFSEDEKKATMIADVEHALLQKPEIFCIYLFFPKSLINDWRSKLLCLNWGMALDGAYVEPNENGCLDNRKCTTTGQCQATRRTFRNWLTVSWPSFLHVLVQ